MTIKHVLAALACATLASISIAAGKPAGNASAGEQKAAACGACHGADGNSPAEIFAALKAPKLAGQVPEYITKSLHDFKAGRRSNEVMSPQAQAVAEVDMADIAAWFSSQKVQPNKAQNNELLAQGEKIFFKGKGRPDVIAACVGCHGLNGIGNRNGPRSCRTYPRYWRQPSAASTPATSATS
jgi:cytochrome c553